MKRVKRFIGIVLCTLCASAQVHYVCAQNADPCTDYTVIADTTALPVTTESPALFSLHSGQMPFTIDYCPPGHFGPLPEAVADLTCGGNTYPMTVSLWFEGCRLTYRLALPTALEQDLLSRAADSVPVFIRVSAYESASVEIKPTMPAPTVLVSEVALSSSNGLTLGNDNTTTTVSATVLPTDADNQTLTWTCIDNNNLVTWDATAHSLTVLPDLHGGEVQVIATATDGSQVADTLTFTILETAIPVSTITLEADKTTLDRYNTEAIITLSVLPNNATDASVTYTITEGIGRATWDEATMTLTRIATATTGHITLTATANDGSGISGSVRIYIDNDPILVSAVTLSSTNGLTLGNDNPTTTISAAVLPTDADNQALDWTCIDNDNLVTWDATAHSLTVLPDLHGGSVQVIATATDGSQVADTLTFTILETAIPVSTITLETNKTTLDRYNTEAIITLSVLPNNATDASVTYSITEGTGRATWDEATMTLTRVATATTGHITLTATANDGSGISGSVRIYIDNDPILVSAVTLSSTNGLTLGNDNPTTTISAAVLPTDADNQTLDWTCIDNNNLVTWDATAHSLTVLPDLHGGSVQVIATATDGSQVADTLTFTILETAIPVSTITLETDKTTLDRYNTEAIITLSVLPNNATDASVTYSITEGIGRATWDEATMTLTRVASATTGHITLTATANDGSGISGSVRIYIDNDPILVSAVTLSSTNGLTLGNDNPTTTISATVLPTDADNQALDWTCIDNDNLVTWDATAHSLTVLPDLHGGSVQVIATATDGSQVADTLTFTILATAIPVSSITLEADKTTLDRYNTEAIITLSVLPSNATDASVTYSITEGIGRATWDEATMTLTRVATATTGHITLTATANDGSGISGSVRIYIDNDPILVTGMSVYVEDGDTTLTEEHTTVTLGATIVPNDADNQTVTWMIISGAEWVRLSGNQVTLTQTENLDGKVILRATANDGSGISADLTLRVKQAHSDMKQLRIHAYDNVTELNDSVNELYLYVSYAPFDLEEISDIQFEIISGSEFVRIEPDELFPQIAIRVVRTEQVQHGTVYIRAYNTYYPNRLQDRIALQVNKLRDGLDEVSLDNNSKHHSRVIMMDGTLYIELNQNGIRSLYDMTGRRVW